MNNRSSCNGTVALAITALVAATLVSGLASAQTDVLYVTDNRVGIGTSTPGYVLEGKTTGVNCAFVTKRTDGATNFMNASASHAQFGAVTNHPVRILVNSTWRFMLSPDNSLSMVNGATCTAGGVWTNASSRSLKKNVETLSSSAAMSTLEHLTPVTFDYKANDEHHVGFIAEDVPDLVASPDRKGLSSMDVVAVLTKVVQEQQKTIRELSDRVAELERGRAR